MGPALILLVAAIASAPMLLHGAYCGDDYEFHLVSWLDAQQSWRHGIVYPHWAPSPNYGAGEPRFVFYPPLTWMLGAGLGLILPWSLVPLALTFILLSGTGLATRALARRMLPDSSAILAGCVAIFSGYALYTAYERAAFGELAGGLWIPLLLLFALRERNRSVAFGSRTLDGSTAPLALALAGCWLSDAPLGVMASYTLAGIAVVCAVNVRSWVPMVRAFLAAVLGLGLTGFYLLPAAWEQRWIDVSQAASGDPNLIVEDNWLFARNVFTSRLCVFMVVSTVVSLLILWQRGRLSPDLGNDSAQSEASYPSLARRWWIPLAFVPLAVFFFQFPFSLQVWNLLPKLRFLQFPSRWLLILEAPMAIFLSAAVWPSARASRWPRRFVCGFFALLFVGSIILVSKTFRDCGPQELPGMLASFRSGAGFWGTGEYSPPNVDNDILATGLPDACLTANPNVRLGVAATPDGRPSWQANQGSCMATATASLREPEHLRIAVVASRAGYLILRLRRYPAWRVTVNGQPAMNLPARTDGLIAVPVPQGPIDLQIEWTSASDVIAGRWLTMIAFLLLVALFLLERKLRADFLMLSREPMVRAFSPGFPTPRQPRPAAWAGMFRTFGSSHETVQQ